MLRVGPWKAAFPVDLSAVAVGSTDTHGGPFEPQILPAVWCNPT